MTMGALAREVKSEMFNALVGIAPSWKQNLGNVAVGAPTGCADDTYQLFVNIRMLCSQRTGTPSHATP